LFPSPRARRAKHAETRDRRRQTENGPGSALRAVRDDDELDRGEKVLSDSLPSLGNVCDYNDL
jgi:hypothetical protein